MSENRKYYYLKLKENFFDSPEIKVMESMENGYLYSNLLMKMYLKSLKSGGECCLNSRIPYSPKMLSSVTGHNIDIIEGGLKTFQALGLIEILDNNKIYMLDIQNFIGESSTEGDRKREYRIKIETEKKIGGQMSGHLSDKRPPEIEIEIETEKEIEIDNKAKKTMIPDEIFQLWNNFAENNFPIKKISKISSERKKKIMARGKEFRDSFPDILVAITEQRFLYGDNKSGWKISLDWLILNDTNYLKVLERKYTDDSPKSRAEEILREAGCLK